MSMARAARWAARAGSPIPSTPESEPAMPSPEQLSPEPEAATPESSEPSTADTPTSEPDTTPPDEPPAAADVSQQERDTAEHHIAELVKEKADELERENLSERFAAPPGRDLDREPSHPEEIPYEGQR